MNRMKLGPLAKFASENKSQETDSDLEPVHDTKLVPLSFFLPEPISGDPVQHRLLSQQFDHELLDATNRIGGFSKSESSIPADLQSDTSTATFVPVNYQSNHAYPVLVWLHGQDGDHRQLLRVMPAVSERNYLGLSLRAPCKLAEQLSHKLLSKSNGWSQEAAIVETTFQQIQSQLDEMAERFNINRNRIFVAGADAGGTLAYRLAFENPESFAGVASFNGGLPIDCTPLRKLAQCRQLPVFWVHGRSNTHLAEPVLCRQLRLLHTAGFDVTLRQYPSDNRLLDPMLGDLNRWMMEMIAKQGANIIS